MKSRRLRRGTLFTAALLIATSAAAKNLHLIEHDSSTGFTIYRTGIPDEKDMRYFCEDLGIQQIVVLSGNGSEVEEKYGGSCPSHLKVVYDYKQSSTCALTAEFLTDFDLWVEEAREKGWQIAFRCNCGCHRTGRLAAYYQMKYQSRSIEDALADLKKKGKWMWWPPLWKRLKAQTIALSNFKDGKECGLKGRKRKYCVVSRDESSCYTKDGPICWPGRQNCEAAESTESKEVASSPRIAVTTGGSALAN